MRRAAIRHKFVDTMPDQLDEGVLYVAIEYRTVSHKCLCGCGHEVVTPLGPTDWKLTYDGVSVSLFPSVGNWSLACRSHYWIDHNAVKWAGPWNDEQIAAGRIYDRQLKATHFADTKAQDCTPKVPMPAGSKPFWRQCLDWLRG
jgi:hypothetical protein